MIKDYQKSMLERLMLLEIDIKRMQILATEQHVYDARGGGAQQCYPFKSTHEYTTTIVSILP